MDAVKVEVLESTNSQLFNFDQLALGNILHYYDNYYELIAKIVSILDSFVPKEIAGHGGCNLSVSHDVENRIVSILYGEIIEEDIKIEPTVESLGPQCAPEGWVYDDEQCEEVSQDIADDVKIEPTVESLGPQCAPEGWVYDDEQCEEVSQDIADDVIEEILESELTVSSSDGMIELTGSAVIPNGQEMETNEINDQPVIVFDEQNGFSHEEDLVIEDTPPFMEEISNGTASADAKYICQYVDCPRKFCRAKEYSIHQEKVHPWLVETEIEVRCKYIHCQARFNSINLLHAHHATHRVRNIARKKSFPNDAVNMSLEKRFVQRKSIPERPVRVRKCEFCETVLDCRVNVYSQHCLEEHDRSPYACPLCRAPFHLQSHLSEHVKTEHSLEEVETFIAQDLWREFTVQEGVRMAECRFCYRIISSQPSRSNHAEQHRKEIWKFCSQCGGKHSEAFCSHPKPKYDARLEKLHCAQCDRWMSKKSFREHLVTHTKDRNFPCTVCKKTFKVQRTATRHIQNHINASNRRRRCYDCAAVFADEAEIPEHYRLEHPMLAPYRCPICGEGFHEKAPLADHCHTHSDDARRMVSIEAPLTSYQIGSARVFECTLCRRSFSTKRSTVAHLIVHTDRPFVCPQCNLSFRIEAMRTMHMVDVHQVKDVSISL